MPLRQWYFPGDSGVILTSAPAQQGGGADPTLLPLATSQTRGGFGYGRSLSANQTYTDPDSSVTVLKLTDATTPSSGKHYHGYSEGGPNISQAWVGGDGHTYYTVFIADGWLVDIRYDTFQASNFRAAPVSGETRLCFSLNQSTPRICYYHGAPSSGKIIQRYDTATDANANTGIFPFTVAAAGTSLLWLQTQVDDVWILGMLNSNQTVVGVKVADGTERSIAKGAHDVDEPHLDREFPIVYISTNDIANWIVDLDTGSTVTESGSYNDFADHECALRGEVVANTWDDPSGSNPGVLKVTKDGVRSRMMNNPSDWSGQWHSCAQWVFSNTNKWWVVDSVVGNDTFPLATHMIGFVSHSLNQVRLLCCGDSDGSTDAYEGGQMHPTMSPDGKLVMWTSNMNNTATPCQIFVAKVPTT